MIPGKRAGSSAGKSPRKKSTPICPKCGSREVIPVLHNPITKAQQRTIDAGRAILADREEW
ncbi:MAG TPA: hypothetical protein VGH22_23885, partial [Candidatus Binatia bacterium]